ncbi:MAG: hypothetical protein LBC93_07045 [Synergistaceae bacterium]|jgi:hypothetical protein|nr:hypothetical protein [Synergistaceae bacterium]
MPIPLIVWALGAGITAAYGVKKGIDAKSDYDDANSYLTRAKDIVEEAKEQTEKVKTAAVEQLEILGRYKIEIMAGTINDFVVHFEKIKNIELTSGPGIDELRNFHPRSAKFQSLKEVSLSAVELMSGGLGAIASGTLVAWGTYGAVMYGGLAVASTGTAIGTLSGAAAVNATLAWLGGGAISAGGFGMAGGMAVLGGLVAGPALAIGGAFMASAAKEAYYEAQSNYKKAEHFAEQTEAIRVVLRTIGERADQFMQLLGGLNVYFKKSVERLASVIELRGVDWGNYSAEQKKEIYKCVQLAQTIKAVLDTPVLTKDGALHPESGQTLSSGRAFLAQLT